MLSIWKGIVLGFSIAAPVGPIGLLCIRRTLMQGRRYGLATGLGAASADMLYGFVAAFGLAAISEFLIVHVFWFQLLGGLFLLLLGVRTFKASPGQERNKDNSNSMLSAFVQTLFLTITNPMTILSFAAMFAGIGLTDASLTPAAAFLMVAGVFTGSMLWWILLCGFVGRIRRLLSHTLLVGINRFSGIIIVAFGLIALYRVFLK